MKKLYGLWIIVLTTLLINLAHLVRPYKIYAQNVSLLSAPYFGTTKVWNIFDHEYPNYDGDPPGDTRDMMHNNGQEYDDPFDHGGGNIYCTGYSGHDGIDYGLYYDYVLAAHGGQVIEAGWDDPNHQLHFGLNVVLQTTYDDITYQTIYGHLSSILVQSSNGGVISSVTQGQVIGISGDTGNSSGPHLHFTVRRPGDNGVFYVVNPYGWNGILTSDPWDQLPNRPASVNLWATYPSIELYSNCNQLPYPDGPEIPYPVSGDPPLTPNLTDPPFTTIVDNSDASPRFQTSGPNWLQQNCAGLPSCYGSTYHTVPRNFLQLTIAKYQPDPDDLLPGQYDLYAYIPSSETDANTDLAHYYIYHHNQTHYAGINQSHFNKPNYPRTWAYLGRYNFLGGGLSTIQERVWVFHQGYEGENLAADAIAFVLVDGPPDIIEEITTGSDDAGIDPACVGKNVTLPEIYMGYCDNGSSLSPIISGFRFSGVNIPIGAVISKAHIQFRVDSPGSNPHSPLRLLFYGENSANSPTFSSENMPADRGLTSESVAWYVPSSAAWAALFDFRYSPNLSPIVQEIIESNWVPGNSSLTFIVKPNPAFPPPSPAQGLNRRVMAYERDDPDGVYDAHLFIWLQCSTPPCPSQ